MSNYDQFRDKLREIFMMDHVELDFGIYRIMNQKRGEINNYLDKVLLPQVKKILGGSNSANAAKLEQQLADAIKASEDAGFDPEMSPKVKQLREQIANSSAGNEELENEVFNHLTIFFSRYYDNGDFVSKRRYKDNAYAIPYNGEEVKLHWANSDQYYIKTSEYFQNYTFNVVVDEKTQKKKKVHFVLKDVTTEQNNNKAASGMERRFALYRDEVAASIEVIKNADGEDELNIYFTYELMPKGTKQDALMSSAFDYIKENLPTGFSALKDTLCPTEKNKKRTLLEKHLTDYTAKSSFDYFIHKDLGGFLRRELDFYIKNEVLLIDDLDEKHIMQQLNQVRAIKAVGEKIITMLAQIEDFQKRLWLKKKFVVQCDYCITLDRVPESFYAEICENEAQRKEWIRLFAIDEIEGYSEPLTEDLLRQNPYLVLDTAFFTLSFKHRLQSKMEDVDKNCNGLLINSENFQALELINKRYQEDVKGIYIDPPYNTDASKIAYKNGFEHSSWLALMENRLRLSEPIMKKNGIINVAIDDYEYRHLNTVMDAVFGMDNSISNIAIFTNPKGRNQGFIAQAHDYSIVYAKDKEYAITYGFELTEAELKKKYPLLINGLRYRELPLKRTGSDSKREDRPYMFFPFLYNRKSKTLSLPEKAKVEGIFNGDTKQFNDLYLADLVRELSLCGYEVILPQSEDGDYLRWRWGYDESEKGIEQGSLFCKKTDSGFAVYQYDEANKYATPKSIWVDKKYDASSKGTNLLESIIPKNPFDYPKSLYTVEDALILMSTSQDTIIDYFAGSGTTGHAAIDLARKDPNGNCRKYVLVEVNHYFDSVTRRRIEKVIYSEDWKKGKPVSRKGISQCFKYIRLEQYEDTLNNLEVKQQGGLFDKDEDKDFRESYMLQYMMDMDTRDSLFNIERFVHPFDVKLKTTRDNELVETNVDMVETFNYLIGLEVDTIGWRHNDDICVLEGRLHRNQNKALIIWRDTEKVDNAELDTFFRKNDYRVKGSEYDVIYVNGDNTLQNQKRDDEHWKVVLIEEEFQKRMFEGC